MLPNAFVGKSTKPTDKELAAELGNSKALWDRLVQRLADDCGVKEQEWNSYSSKAGWSLRLKNKKRNIAYLGPCHGSFLVAFVLGEKAMKAAQQAKLPSRIVELMHEAKRYPEGYAVRLEVVTPQDIDAIEKLALAKLQN